MFSRPGGRHYTLSDWPDRQCLQTKGSKFIGEHFHAEPTIVVVIFIEDYNASKHYNLECMYEDGGGCMTCVFLHLTGLTNDFILSTKHFKL